MKLNWYSFMVAIKGKLLFSQDNVSQSMIVISSAVELCLGSVQRALMVARPFVETPQAGRAAEQDLFTE